MTNQLEVKDWTGRMACLWDSNGKYWSCDPSKKRYYDPEKRAFCINIEKAGKIDWDNPVVINVFNPPTPEEIRDKVAKAIAAKQKAQENARAKEDRLEYEQWLREREARRRDSEWRSRRFGY
jgi:hypothetical protein